MELLQKRQVLREIFTSQKKHIIVWNKQTKKLKNIIFLLYKFKILCLLKKNSSRVGSLMDQLAKY